MAKDVLRLKRIFQKTDGRCHICRGKLSFCNHGKIDARGAWHVEHSIPRASGGTQHLNNLYAACIDCNLTKGVRSTRSVRSSYGYMSAPLSRELKVRRQEQNTVTGTMLGVGVGALIAGKAGAFIGGLVGGIIGYNHN